MRRKDDPYDRTGNGLSDRPLSCGVSVYCAVYFNMGRRGGYSHGQCAWDDFVSGRLCQTGRVGRFMDPVPADSV